MQESKLAFYNLRVNNLSSAEFFRCLDNRLSAGQQVTVNFLNAHCFNVAQTDREYRNALDRGTFLLNDGIGVDIAGWLCGIRFRENLNGTDLIPDILEFAEKTSLSVYLYGSHEEVVTAAIDQIRLSYPDLSLAGYSNGFETDANLITDDINATRPDIVIVGMGVPRQELWVDENSKHLESVRLFVCGGAILDFLSGEAMRAPLVLRKLRLEWLFRLLREPGRLFSRYITGSFRFLFHIVRLR